MLDLDVEGPASGEEGDNVDWFGEGVGLGLVEWSGGVRHFAVKSILCSTVLFSLSHQT